MSLEDNFTGRQHRNKTKFTGRQPDRNTNYQKSDFTVIQLKRKFTGRQPKRNIVHIIKWRTKHNLCKNLT